MLVDEKDIVATKLLNFKQKCAYDMILKKVFNKEPTTFLIDGPNGSRKTYLYRAILATIRSNNLTAFSTTSSRVVALILLSGRTTHTRSKILLNIEDSNVCNVSKR